MKKLFQVGSSGNGVHTSQKSSDDIELQIQAEQLRRMTKEKREKYMAGNQIPAQRESTYTSSSVLGFNRIRINCSIILGYLGEVSDNSKSWTMQSHTFLNPFAILIHYQDAMRSALGRLERKLDTRGESGSINTGAGFPAVSGALTRDERLAVEMVSDKAHKHLKCYVILPDSCGAKGRMYFNPTNARIE